MASLINQVTSNQPVLGRDRRRKQEGNNKSKKPAAKLMFALYSSSKQGSKGEVAAQSRTSQWGERLP